MNAKKKIKINFRYFWEGFNPEDNFFTNLLKKRYDVVIDNNPDYLFYSVFPDNRRTIGLLKNHEFIKSIFPNAHFLLRKVYLKIKKPFKKGIVHPSGNFVKIFFASEHVRPEMDKCDWAFSSYFEEDIANKRYFRIPMYMVVDDNCSLTEEILVKKKLNFKKIKKEKIKFCNFIYSQEIPSRNKFFKELRKYRHIDSPGGCMNNMSPIGSKSSRSSRASNNWADKKMEFLKNYKFTIAFENFSSSGWVTEKLTHPMKVNSIPIYIGHKDVEKEFNTKSFINCNNFKNQQEFIKFIIKVDNDEKLYKKILNEPWLIDNKKPKYLETDKILKNFEKIFN